MGQFSKVLQLLIMHTVPQMALDCRPGLGGLIIWGSLSVCGSLCGSRRHISTSTL